MTQKSDFKGYGEELERRLQLRTSPIAIKLIKTEKEIPVGDLDAARELPNLPSGEYIDVVSAPLRKTDFAPQMRPEYPLFPNYIKAGKLVGLDVHE